MPAPPTFLLHTGDISQLSKPYEFDTAEQVLKGAGRGIFYVPGEHDVLNDGGNTWNASERHEERAVGTALTTTALTSLAWSTS